MLGLTRPVGNAGGDEHLLPTTRVRQIEDMGISKYESLFTNLCNADETSIQGAYFRHEAIRRKPLSHSFAASR